MRRLLLVALLSGLLTIIGAYVYATDSARVRATAQAYLSHLLGANVTVGRATLSIFEGLRLDRVQVRLPEVATAATRNAAPPPPLLSADAIVIRGSIGDVLAGRLVTTEVVVERPHIRLTDRVDAIAARYHEMMDESSPSRRAVANHWFQPHLAMPEIALRDARVDYSEQRDGRAVAVGSLVVDGHVSPAGTGDQQRYAFVLQSRGASDAVGPTISGYWLPREEIVRAELHHFELGPDIRLMLPAQVRHWWEDHQLSGRVDITELSYTLPRAMPAVIRAADQSAASMAANGTYTVRAALNDVTIVVHPEELMGPAEARQLAAARLAAGQAATLYNAAGFPAGREPIAPVANLFQAMPIRVEDVSGTAMFTTNAIDVDATSRIEGNALRLVGRVDGYPTRQNPAPPARLHITSEGRPIALPTDPPFVNSLPLPLRSFFTDFSPSGTCSLDVDIARDADAKPAVTGIVNVLDGNFCFAKFPYPLRQASGRVTFEPGDANKPAGVRLALAGNGIAGGPNANAIVTLGGTVAPLEVDAGVDIRVSGEDVHDEPAVLAAFPPEVQRAMRLFDTHRAGGGLPRFSGGFMCDIHREAGHDRPVIVNTDVRVDDATATLADFPYPLEHIATELKIGPARLDILHGRMRRGDATLAAEGFVTWTPPPDDVPADRRPPLATETHLSIAATNLPIDDALLNALPPERQAAIRKLGLGGTLDAAGIVSGGSTMRAGGADQVASPVPSVPAGLRYAFDIALHHATVWPAGGAFALSDVNGAAHVEPERIALTKIVGHRGGGTAQVDGAIDLPTPARAGAIDLTTTFAALPLDPPLYALLPPDARRAWDAVQPRGAMDGAVRVAGPMKGQNIDRPDITATLHPRGMSAKLRVLPYAVDNIAGTVRIDGTGIALDNLTGKHGNATIRVSGTGPRQGNGPWRLALAADNVPADDALRAALPPAMSAAIDQVTLRGTLSLAMDKLAWSPAANGGDDPDVDAAGRVSIAGGNLDVGVPIEDADVALDFTAALRGGTLRDMNGTLTASRFLLAGRAVQQFSAAVARPAGTGELRLSKMRAGIAGGELAGSVVVNLASIGGAEPPAAAPAPQPALVETPTAADAAANAGDASVSASPGRFAVDLVLRDADAANIAQTADPKTVRGTVSASLALEGSLANPADRRGRGDLLATGKDMANLPVVLGLLQITNLALPVSSPFNQASARYSIAGRRVTFENVTLRTINNVMAGSGHLDFDTRQVALTFTTGNPDAPRVPFLSDLWSGAQRELFTIEVRGTVQKPTVSARSLNTFQTTVDNVLRTRQP